MNKKTLSTIISLYLLVLYAAILTPAMAAETEMELLILPSDISINTTETSSVTLTIINNQENEDTFSLSVWPSTTWASITPNLEKDKIINLAPGANASTNLYFTVSSGADEIVTTFLVTARSVTVKNVSESEAVNVRVLRKTDIYISDLTLDTYLLDPSDCVNMRTTITNFGSTSGPYKLQTDVKSGSFLIERFEDYIELVEERSIKSISNNYCFDKYIAAGTYRVETTLKSGLNKFVDARSATVRIKEVPEQERLVYEKSTSYSPFAQMRVIKVKNEGNVIQEEFYVTESVSELVSKFFYPEKEPMSSEKVDGRVSYKWLIESLAPGEETEIKYEIRFFSIWFSGLMIVVLVFFAFSYVYKPRIRKTVNVVGPLRRSKEMSILLEVRNSTIHEIKNVIVNDTILPIAKLVERFDTMKPATKKTEAGTELTWKIKSLQPLEERILTYRIKPVVDIIGSMRLPSAIMSYVDNKKEKKTIASRSVEIK